MARKLIRRVVLVWLAAGLLWLAFGPRAQAATFRGNPIVCSSLATTAFDVAQMRDAGILWEDFSPWIQMTLATAMANPSSYIKDNDDMQFVYEWFKRIWDNPNLEAVELVGMVERDCLKTPASLKGKRGKVA